MKRKVEHAICNNDEEAVATAIYDYAAAKRLKTEQNGDVYDFSDQGLQNALNVAAENGSYEVFLRLLKAKDMGDISEPIDLTIPFYKASENNRFIIIEHILWMSNYSQIIRSNQLHMACHLACKKGHSDLVNWFFENKSINVNHEAIVEGEKTTMLLSAILEQHYDLAFYLLKHPDLDPGSLEYSALRASYEQLFDNKQIDGNIDLVEAILNHPKIDPTFGAQYPFRVACSLNLSDTVANYLKDPKVKPLLATSYYLDVKLDSDWILTPEYNEIEPLQELLPQDPKVIPNTKPFHSLHQVCKIGCFQTALILFEQVKIDPSLDNNILLGLACWKGQTSVIGFLLQDPRVILNLNLVRFLRLSIQTKAKGQELFTTILNNPAIESRLITKPAEFSAVINMLVSQTEDPYDNVHILLNILLEKMIRLETFQRINAKELISQEMWIALFNTSIWIYSPNYKWIHEIIELEALNKIEFYSENLKKVIHYKDRVTFCLEKASSLIPPQVILEAFNSSLKSYNNIEITKILQKELTLLPDPSFIIEFLSTLETSNYSAKINEFVEMLLPLLPEANGEMQDEILSKAWEKDSLLLTNLLPYFRINASNDSYAPIALVYTLWASSCNGSDMDAINFEKSKKILHKLCNHPAVNIELLFKSHEENEDLKQFLFSALLEKPESIARAILFEKFKLLTLFGARNSNPNKECNEQRERSCLQNNFS